MIRLCYVMIPLLLMRDIVIVAVYLESPGEKMIHPVWLLWSVDYLMAHALAC